MTSHEIHHKSLIWIIKLNLMSRTFFKHVLGFVRTSVQEWEMKCNKKNIKIRKGFQHQLYSIYDEIQQSVNFSEWIWTMVSSILRIWSEKKEQKKNATVNGKANWIILRMLIEIWEITTTFWGSWKCQLDIIRRGSPSHFINQLFFHFIITHTLIS